MRRTIVPAVALLLAACAGSDVQSARTFESPCAAAEDCDSEICLDVGEYSICSMQCGSCPDGYSCIDIGPAPSCPSGTICTARSACYPDPGSATTCRGEDLPCGAAYAACCGGLVCGAWPDVPWTCTRQCLIDADCETGCCVPTSGGGVGGVCGPPHLCR